MTKKIYFAVPNRESSSQMTAELSQTISQLSSSPSEYLPDTGDDWKVEVMFSYLQPVDANRNKLVKQFLDDPDGEWLFMCDSDVVPPVDVLKMVEFDRRVVSAITCIKKKRVPQPIILKRDGDTYRQVGVSEYREEIDSDTGLLEVDGVGTGCLLVHRSVFEELEPPWFKFMYNEWGGLELGEDFYFSRRLAENGVSMFVSSDHVAKHYRTVDLTEFAMSVIDGKNDVRQRFANRVDEVLDGEDLRSGLEGMMDELPDPSDG